ncbi:hypothetical protein [Papillibacter cinnamivorans]|uniref:Uncharacterized protein n=1 Tax=Papillibacter cinnamivorans DSM 12816 TaxID=1122930 RepID=A0A1W2CAL1_9FIRM|nr:hypothetical protein [Papillibacter cinnamivorans]SMC81728.1 hypothetical protein SAMN02745168_2606 [Papillibacter cinnamivorans DSM 12816]
MVKWTADFGNDPNDDYNLIVIIYCNEEDVAIIRNLEGELVLQWFAKKPNLEVPVDWLIGLLVAAKERLARD